MENTFIKEVNGKDYLYSRQTLTELRDSDLKFGNISFVVEEKKTKHIYLGKKNYKKLEEKRMKDKIGNLIDNQNKVDLIAEVVEIQPIRYVKKCTACNKRWSKPDDKEEVCPACGKKEIYIQTVTNAKIKDDTGQCNIDLWREDIKLFEVGDKLHLMNGFAKVNHFKDKEGVQQQLLVVTKGKYGVIRKV